MSRRVQTILVFTISAALAGCQNYNFNPVGHCIIQPGSTTFTLSALSSSDVLFVIDDSGSMKPKQDNLRNNFASFIGQLNTINLARINSGQDPLDFHIAITTSSIFQDLPVQSDPSNTLTCTDFGGSSLCKIGKPRITGTPGIEYSCSPLTSACGDYSIYYGRPSCSIAVGTPYPQGSFVAAAGNPKVLNFEKNLYQDANGNPSIQTAAINALIEQFKANADVGVCGSGEEQHIEAGKLAVQKALAHQQTETTWPHPGAKLVLVFLGDEDDCSNPADPANAIILASSTPGNDSCMSAEGQQKLFKVDDYVSYFTGLRRPLGAAFITGLASGSTCDFVADPTGANCNPGQCVTPGQTCGPDPTSCGAVAGTRHVQLAKALRAKGADVVVGSICDTEFSATLIKIADLLKPPNTLSLTTTPAASEVTILRITDSSGKQRKLCKGPAPAGGSTAGYDWWFVAADGTNPPATGPSQTIYINHGSGQCELNPGDTYSAEYLGQVPEGGCLSATECQQKLGGNLSDWTCTAAPGSPTRGTCLCATGG